MADADSPVSIYSFLQSTLPKVSLGNLPSRKLRQSDTALSKDDYSNVEDYAFQPIYAFENILEGLVVFTNGLILLTIFYV